MSQPATHPHHMSNLLEPALIEIVHAVCDRPNQTMADYEAKADATWALLESFQPRDAIDLLLSGQLVAFNAVFADATLRLLGGMDDTLKKQTLSSLVSMGRVTQGHVDRLAKRGNQPYRTEIEAPVAAAAPPKSVGTAPMADAPPDAARAGAVAHVDTPHGAAPGAAAPGAAAPPVAGTAALSAAATGGPPSGAETLSAPPPHDDAALPAARSPDPEASAASPDPASAPTPCPATADPTSPDAPTRGRTQSAVAATSWLDEPYQEYIIETPGLLAAQERAARTAAVLRLMEATQQAESAEPRAASVPEPATTDAS